MIDELSEALDIYEQRWRRLIVGCKDKTFFEGLKPTAVAWKMVDMDDFDRRFAALRPLCDQIHLGWVNERWLATLHLKETTLPWDIEIVKLFERRPSSTDAVGLDHVDFLVPEDADGKAIVSSEDLKWTEEKSGKHCKWLSLWFDGTEAKLRSDTVLQVCADEMLEYQEIVLKRLKTSS